MSRCVTALHVLFMTLLVLPAALPLFGSAASPSLLQLFNLQLLVIFVAGAMVRHRVKPSVRTLAACAAATAAIPANAR